MDFLWESISDVRDLEEDLHNGVTTLATTFGVQWTLALLAASTIIGDVCITSVGGGGGMALTSISRPVSFWGAFSVLAVFKPRRAIFSWGAGMLVGLLPVWLASLGESDYSTVRN